MASTTFSACEVLPLASSVSKETVFLPFGRLLKALELGVYDHVKGDGREFVITDPTAMKIRAEDGRSITNTDISMFINNVDFP